MLVRVSESCDDREADSFKRRLNEAGLALDFVRNLPRLKMDVMRLIRS